MFERSVDYPTAITNYDDEGVDIAIDWCHEHMKAGDTLTVWTYLKSNLRGCPQLERLLTQHRNVKHVTGRGGGSIHDSGPVLMAWADMNDIGNLVQHSDRKLRALCVIALNEEEIKPWVSAARPTILGDVAAWRDMHCDVDAIFVEALKDISRMVNLSNAISVGIDKDIVVSTLFAVHGAGVPMNGKAAQGWALAHGWSGNNPERLAQYVDDISAGKRPRTKRVVGSEYIDALRRRVSTEQG